MRVSPSVPLPLPPAPQANITKGDILRQYKFCIAMEDVASRDYVTEQVGG